MTIATGLVGYGLGGSVFHAPVIQACPRFTLHAIATSRPVPDGVTAVADPYALIADPALDLIVIASPNAEHVPLACAALEAGKHVVVEKPFTATTAQADVLIALAKDRGRLLTVFHNRRWDGASSPSATCSPPAAWARCCYPSFAGTACGSSSAPAGRTRRPKAPACSTISVRI